MSANAEQNERGGIYVDIGKRFGSLKQLRRRYSEFIYPYESCFPTMQGIAPPGAFLRKAIIERFLDWRIIS